jgi:gliding motility-associated-like protein
LHFPFDVNVENTGDSTYAATLSGATYVPTAFGQGLFYDGFDDYVKVEPSLWLSENYSITSWIYYVYDSGVYSDTIDIAPLCDSVVTITLTEFPDLFVAFTIAYTITCEKSNAKFTDLSDISDLWISTTWDFGDGSGSTDQNPLHTYNPLGNYTIVLYVSNGICHDYESKSIIVEEEILFYIPNAFTPDGDPFNNSFRPVFVSGFDPYDYHLTIFNRWGEIVFESYNAANGWDGTFGDSAIVHDGVYVWQIEFGDINSDEKYTHTGHLTLLK